MVGPMLDEDRAVFGPPAPRAEVMAALPAVPESGSVVRQRLRAWLADLGWPSDEREDIVVAVNEAVANVIDHAYPPAKPGQVRVYGWQVPRPAGRCVVVTIIDDGRWRPARLNRSNRGRGLLMMNVCAASLMLEPTDRGTTVIIVSPDVPAGRHGARPPE
jgi:serine/threonine-protein kinase RsbW